MGTPGFFRRFRPVCRGAVFPGGVFLRIRRGAAGPFRQLSRFAAGGPGGAAVALFRVGNGGAAAGAEQGCPDRCGERPLRSPALSGRLCPAALLGRRRVRRSRPTGVPAAGKRKIRRAAAVIALPARRTVYPLSFRSAGQFFSGGAAGSAGEFQVGVYGAGDRLSAAARKRSRLAPGRGRSGSWTPRGRPG